MQQPLTGVVLSCAAILFGCGGGAGSPRFTVVDSAGVSIATNGPGSVEAAPEWSLTAEPVRELGTEGAGDVTFFRITTVVPLADGRVIVGSASPARAEVLAPAGTVTATLGRAGEGPGEFSAFTSAVPFAVDSVAAWDQNRRRLSVFTMEGRYARDVDLGELVLPSPEAVGSMLDDAAFSYLLPATDRSFWLFGVGGFGAAEGVRRVEVPSHRISAAGERLATLGPFPGLQSFMSEQTGVAPYPFGANTYGAALGDTLVIGTAEESRLELYGPSGNLARIVRWPEDDRTVGGPRLAAWTDWLESRLAELPPAEREGIRAVLDAIPPAERFPAYDGLLVSDADEVWVGDYPGQIGLPGVPWKPPEMPARRWLVFASDGELRARVHTPAGFTPDAVAGRLVWGVFKDELGVETVRGYGVLRR